MGNLFSSSNNSTPAPSASYTVTPTNTSNDSNNDGVDDSNQCSNNDGSVSPAGPKVFRSDDSDLCLDVVFNSTVYTVLFWILIIFLFYLLIKAIYRNKGSTNETNGQASYSRTIDIILCFLLFAAIFSTYFNLPDNEKENFFGYSLQWLEDFFGSVWGLFQLIWFTIIFFALVYILRVPMTPDVKPIIVRFVETKIWIVYLIFAIVLFFQYFLNVPVLKFVFDNSVMNYFKTVQPYDEEKAEECGIDLDEELTSSPGISPCTSDKQVFNVGNNLYTYEEAQKVCSAFDASLATYDQIENAYNTGAEWCNYGWSQGQMAFFPTQKNTWEQLQNNPRTKQICGRPGINGGYMKNPYIRFGANCYGIKPKQPDNWTPTSYVTECKTKKDDIKEKIRESAVINSFNTKKWSRY
jgi:hypothetical protein